MFNMETFQIVVGLLYTKIRYIEIHFQVYIQNPYLALKKLAIIYILCGQKFIKNAKNGQFWRVFENLKLAVKQCYQMILIGQKLVKNALSEK